jgi:lambda family phage portal protein
MLETDAEAEEFAEIEGEAQPRTGGDLSLEGNRYALGASLYRSLESAPGQVYITPPLLSANEELASSRAQAVRQARHVERTSEHVRSGINKAADLGVGSQLRVTATPDWLALGFTDRAAGIKWARLWGRQAESLFHSWGYDSRLLADSEGTYTFGGMMWMAWRNRKGPDGECALVIHTDQERAVRYGTKWWTHVQVIDPQRIETPPEQQIRESGVLLPSVVDGRLLDENGRWIGFWYRKNPEVRLGVGAEYAFVPREIEGGRAMGIHWFQKTRGAAQRGITDMVNMLRRATKLETYDDYTIGAAAVAAALMTYIKTSRPKKDVAEDLNVAPGSPGVGADLVDLDGLVQHKVDYYKKLNLRNGTNRIPMLDLDDELIIQAANAATQDATAFRNGYLREFASALGIDFEQFSGYYGDVNYSSARMALINIMRGVQRERGMFYPAVASPIFGCIIEEAIVKGWLPLAPAANGDVEHFYQNREAYTRCRWTAPGIGWVDPQKEATAAQTRTDVAAPISTLGDEAGAQGRTIDDLIEERADEQQLLVDAGLIADKTVRATVKGGAATDPSAGADNPAPQPRENQRGG